MSIVMMNYSKDVATLDIGGWPVRWERYMDRMMIWRQYLKFDSQKLEDMYSERVLRKALANRDKIYLRVNPPGRQYVVSVRRYTFEQCVSANPNITERTVEKYAHLLNWDYANMKPWRSIGGSLSDAIKEYYENLTDAEKEGCRRRYLHYNYDQYSLAHYKWHLDQFIASQNGFELFCQNPSVSAEYLLEQYTYKRGLTMGLTTLTNPNMRWHHIVEYFQRANLFAQKGSPIAVNKRGESDPLGYLYKDSQYRVEQTYLDSINAHKMYLLATIFQKPDVPIESVLSLMWQREFTKNFDSLSPLYLHADTPLWIKRQVIERAFNTYPAIKLHPLCDAQAYVDITGIESIDELDSLPRVAQNDSRPRDDGSNSADDIRCRTSIVFDDAASYDGDDIDSYNYWKSELQTTATPYRFTNLVFSQPYPKAKLDFLIRTLTSAAIKIQQWYREYLYRPDSDYVTRVLKPRFETNLQKRKVCTEC
nr:orf061-like protein [Calliteara abietis nucleopolyhedrovirus]